MVIDMNDENTGNIYSQVPEEEVKEFYRFNFSKDELKEIQHIQIKHIISRPVIFILVSIALLVFTNLAAPNNVGTSFILAFLLINGISTFKSIKAHNNSWKKHIERISSTIYEYKVYESYIKISLFYNGEIVRESKHLFTDIEQIRNSDKWLLLIISNQLFILRKNELNASSAFNPYMHTHPEKTKEFINKDMWNLFSAIFFVASLFSPFFANILLGTLSNANGLFTENFWVFFVMTVIPISSVCFGFILKNNGRKYKKNIIIGLIMTFILYLFGMEMF